MTVTLLQGIIRGILYGFSRCEPGSDIKIQIRRREETIWRDYAFVSDNPDAVQSTLYAATRSADGVAVRAVDRSGRIVDFR
ncbi:MAG: hypothetical protein BGP05_09415 [Rhizobiales bacterium 62-47]|nr:MAG: hypothetical protein BGP05_09415 [Rhizobiales bacterium 62-47]